MAGEEQPKKARGSVMAWLIVVALLGVVVWLASERNARRWVLVVDSGHLTVQRGRSFPTGTRTVLPTDPELGKAYAPIPIPAGARPVEGEFDERVGLDRALFDQLMPWARTAAANPDPAAQRTAMALAERASLLPGLAPAQLDQLGALRGELAYTAALGEMQLAAGLLESARRRLHQAQQQGGARALAAGALLGDLKSIADRLGDMSLGRVPPAGSPEPFDPDAYHARKRAAEAPRPDAGARDAGAVDAGR